ncbi:MAG: extensin family protein [Alphaproteobacteria bacterium]|nr:extensin family protein [Alphaproteobacteria bacterium]
MFEPIPAREGPHGCRLIDGVRMTRSSVPLDQPVQVNCDLAARQLSFEDDVVQAAARRHFGQPLARIRHFGGYSCRNETGNSRRLSQHALGNAFDISGFDLADGTQITVSRHWNDRGPRGAFLRDVAHGACRYFHVVLTPRTDAAHRTHLHLDLGPYRRCDA